MAGLKSIKWGKFVAPSGQELWIWDDLSARKALPEDLHVARGGKDALQAVAHDLVVVGDEDADHPLIEVKPGGLPSS